MLTSANMHLPAGTESGGTTLGYEFARYLKVRGAWGASWSPDGARVSFLTEITGVPQVWEVAAEGPSWPEQLTFYEERVSGALYSPTENRLLFGMDAGGNERSQLFLLEDGEVKDLTGAPEAIHYSWGLLARRKAHRVYGDPPQRDGLRCVRPGTAGGRARDGLGGLRLPYRGGLGS